MPHAALWVVQLSVFKANGISEELFQCRTRLCGWCSKGLQHQRRGIHRFNAARGFVGGAALISQRKF